MTSSTDAADATTSRGGTQLFLKDRLGAVAGVTVLAGAAAVFAFMPSSLARFRSISSDGFYKQEVLRLDTILIGVFLAAFMLTPAVAIGVRRLRGLWRDGYTYGALAGTCVFFWLFLVHFGRWQFGGWDYNILIDTGWRQIFGQRPYVDFPATTPAGFHLGIKYAFELFGLNWDANLYLSAIFTCVTFLWMYWLMALLEMGRLASLATAFAIEAAAMLTLCFWWYNNSVLILAAVFFLSCLVYARRPRPVLTQASYLVSLVMLSLMKPNIAGLTIVGCVALLFLVTDRKLRLIVLTLGAVIAALSLLALNHVPVGAMLESFLSVAKGRGGVSARFGYRQMSLFERHSALLWVAVVATPLLALPLRWVKQIRQRDWREVVLSFFFPLALLVALYGLLTNGEFRDAECTVLLAAGGVLTFGLQWNRHFLRRVYVAILCASMAADLYYGATRARVYEIGPHMFFEWQDNEHRIDSGFLKNMMVSATVIEIERETKQALTSNPGPYFFGPRMEFNYAVYRVPSPDHFPTYWQPGTSVPDAEVPQLIDDWKNHRFETLLFMKDGLAGSVPGGAYSFYQQDFLEFIQREYVKDESYPDLTVYRRRTGQP